MPPKTTALAVRHPARLFKALGDENRLRIVALLSVQELCVCHIEAALALSQPTVSRHLSVLKSCGVVESRRQGTWVYYHLATQADPIAEAHLRLIVASFSSQGVLRESVSRLLNTMGPTACR